METKVCTKCKEEKSVGEFSKDKSSRAGLRYVCKACASEYNRKWHEENKEKRCEYQREYQRKWDKGGSPAAKRRRISNNLRARVNRVLKGNFKSAATLELLGCSIEELKQHIEAQFTEGMTWDSWSFDGWHIDHIRPCASFDLSDPEQQKACFHYTNLQPLWSEDNMLKSDKIVDI